MTLRTALDELLGTLAGVEAPIVAALADRPDAGHPFRGAGDLVVADEVREYFRWCNGLRPDRVIEIELFPNAVMLSLDEALADHRRLTDMAAVVSAQTGLPADSVWQAGWLPLFRHPAGGEYHVTLAGTAAPTAPIYSVAIEDPEAALPAFDSLTTLVQTITECYRVRAWRAGADGTVSEERSRAGEIIRMLNPITTSTLLQWPRE